MAHPFDWESLLQHSTFLMNEPGSYQVFYFLVDILLTSMITPLSSCFFAAVDGPENRSEPRVGPQAQIKRGAPPHNVHHFEVARSPMRTPDEDVGMNKTE